MDLTKLPDTDSEFTIGVAGGLGRKEGDLFSQRTFFIVPYKFDGAQITCSLSPNSTRRGNKNMPCVGGT